jgi:hypothetical protein
MVSEAAEAPRRHRAWAPREVRLLEIEPIGLAIPGSCACCGAAAASSRVETRPTDGKTLVVPYCDACQGHASAATTRSLSAALASAVLGITLCLALPLVWESVSMGVHVAIVVAAALVPLALFAIARRGARSGHTATGRAVWWTKRGELACTSARWAAELAASSGSSSRLERSRERVLSAWAFTGPIVLLVAAPLVHRFHNPELRVLNLTENRLSLLVDGRMVAVVEPTSAESPAAGLDVRIPSGRRSLRTLGPDGRDVDAVVVDVESGAYHLYAPASDGHCFWLERTVYGRNRPDGSARQALEGPVRFWRLPRTLDSLFAPNPEPAAADRRSTGGELVALRQARCNEAPADVRHPPR